MLRIDYIFSYWIFIWFILYCLKITKYNPKFAILLGILENIIVLILMSYYNTDKSIIILFILMFIILKFIPLKYARFRRKRAYFKANINLYISCKEI
jgi:hypothetical protein